MHRETRAKLVEARDYLADQTHRPIRLVGLSAEIGYSPFHLHRLFAETFQETPGAFLRRLKIERAKQALLFTEATVSEICFELGYLSLGSFSSAFAEQTGFSPTEFRRQARRSFAMGRLWSHRFVPACFLRSAIAFDANRKIG